MTQRSYSGKVERMRDPKRLAILEVERVAELSLDGITAKKMLDIGTGSAVFAGEFAARGLNVTGIDLNIEMLEAARQFVPQGEFQYASADDIPYSDDSFDLVFMGHVLHEVDDPVKTLREVRRVAKTRVVVLEWPYVEEKRGPKLSHRLQPEQVTNFAQEAGFAKTETLSLNHMALYCLDAVDAAKD